MVRIKEYFEEINFEKDREIDKLKIKIENLEFEK
jgi:hypothetical protein